MNSYVSYPSWYPTTFTSADYLTTPSWMQGGASTAGAASSAGSSAGSSAAGAGAGGVGVLGGISIGSSIGQAVGSIYSAWESGKTAKYVAAKQAEIAEYNRRGAQLAAETAYIAGAGQIAKITMEAGAIRGAQRTAYASRGVTGSSMKEVMASSEVMKRIDVATAKMNAMQAAWGYKTQASGFAAQAANGSSVGSYMQAYNRMKGFDSALGQATEVADKWYKYFGGASEVADKWYKYFGGASVKYAG